MWLKHFIYFTCNIMYVTSNDNSTRMESSEGRRGKKHLDDCLLRSLYLLLHPASCNPPCRPRWPTTSSDAHSTTSLEIERFGLSNSGTSECVGMVFPIFTKHIPNDYYIHTEASARRCKWREMDKRSLRSQRSVRRLGKEVIDWAGNESVAACLHLRKSAVVFLLARRIAAVVFLLLRLNTRQTEASCSKRHLGLVTKPTRLTAHHQSILSPWSESLSITEPLAYSFTFILLAHSRTLKILVRIQKPRTWKHATRR